MRAWIAQVATPRRLVAAECCFAVSLLAVLFLIRGLTPLALLALALCVVAMVPAFATVARLERRD